MKWFISAGEKFLIEQEESSHAKHQLSSQGMVENASQTIFSKIQISTFQNMFYGLTPVHNQKAKLSTRSGWCSKYHLSGLING